MFTVNLKIGSGIGVDFRIPQTGGLDDGPQVFAFCSQFTFHESHGSPFRQTSEAFRGDVSLAPKTEVALVGGTDHVRKVRQPQRKRKVLGVSFIRPNTFKNELKRYTMLFCNRDFGTLMLALLHKALCKSTHSLSVCGRGVTHTKYTRRHFHVLSRSVQIAPCEAIILSQFTYYIPVFF